jgi:raffinose/stachyose/melibiose transport system permease protein
MRAVDFPLSSRPVASPRVNAVTRVLDRFAGYAYVAPAFTLFVLFLAFPVGFAVWLAFHSWDGFTPIGQATYVGLDNFRALLSDPIAREAARNTVFFAVGTTLAECAIGYVLAFTLWYYRPKFASWLRNLYFFPCVVSMVVVGLAWRQILAPGGPADALSQAVGFGSINWLGSSSLVLWVVVAVATWQWAGWTMILLLAGMTTVPREVVEAAELDGAQSWTMASRIVLPLITPVLWLAVLLDVIGGFQVFDTIYVMTGGGPYHASEVLGTYAYWIAFSPGGTGDLGYASALAVVMVAVLFVFSYLRIRMARLV